MPEKHLVSVSAAEGPYPRWNQSHSQEGNAISTSRSSLVLSPPSAPKPLPCPALFLSNRPVKYSFSQLFVQSAMHSEACPALACETILILIECQQKS